MPSMGAVTRVLGAPSAGLLCGQGGCCDWAPFLRNLVSVTAVLLNSGGTAVVSTLLRLPRLRELRCRAVPESLVGLRLQVPFLVPS